MNFKLDGKLHTVVTINHLLCHYGKGILVNITKTTGVLIKGGNVS